MINPNILKEKKENKQTKTVLDTALIAVSKWLMYAAAILAAGIALVFWFFVEVMLRPFREE